MNEFPNGGRLAGRIERLESDAREQRDRRDRVLAGNEEAHRRLHERDSAIDRRLAVLETQLREWRENMTEDLREIKGDCTTTRGWVELQLKEREEAEREKSRLTSAQKIAITGGIVVVVSAMISAVATLVSAGAI